MKTYFPGNRERIEKSLVWYKNGNVLNTAFKISEHKVDEKVISTSQYKVNYSTIFKLNYSTVFLELLYPAWLLLLIFCPSGKALF